MRRALEDGHFYRYVPAAWDALIRQTARTDGWWLSPSGVAGCQRLHLLKASEDYYLNPNKVWAMLVGTAVHRHLETGEYLEEVPLRMPLLIPLELPNGERKVVEFPVAGTLDRYEPPWKRITDYKFPSEFSYQQYDPNQGRRVVVPKTFPEPHHVAQVNIYRMLLEYNGYPVEQAQIFYARPYKEAPRKVVAVPLWDLEDTYQYAVEVATPLALARETGQLPPCTCRFPNKTMDRDLCQEISDEAWRACGGPSRVRTLPPLGAEPGEGADED